MPLPIEFKSSYNYKKSFFAMSKSFLNLQSWQVDMRRNVHNVIMINHIGGGGGFPEVNKLLCCIFHANNVNIVYCSSFILTKLTMPLEFKSCLGVLNLDKI